MGTETRGAGNPQGLSAELRTAASGPRGPSGARKLRPEDARDVKGPRRLATPAPGGLKSETGKADSGAPRGLGMGEGREEGRRSRPLVTTHNQALNPQSPELPGSCLWVSPGWGPQGRDPAWPIAVR